jgi:hypothetical protein
MIILYEHYSRHVIEAASCVIWLKVDSVSEESRGHSFTLKLEISDFSESFVTFYQITWRHISEQTDLHRRE